MLAQRARGIRLGAWHILQAAEALLGSALSGSQLALCGALA